MTDLMGSVRPVSLSLSEAVGITFAVSVLPLVTIGFLLGLMVMYFIMRSRIDKMSWPGTQGIRDLIALPMRSSAGLRLHQGKGVAR